MNSCVQAEQANISDHLRVLLRRKANEVGGVSKLARIVGMNAHRYYNQMNRGNGILADLIVEHCKKTGDDAPLRILADAAGYEVIPKVSFLRKAHPGKSIRSFALDVHHATNALTMIVEEVLNDKRRTSVEKENIEDAAQKAKTKIAELVARVFAEGGS